MMVSCHDFPLPFTGYADHGIPLKGRSPQSLDQVKVRRVQVDHCMATTPYNQIASVHVNGKSSSLGPLEQFQCTKKSCHFSY